MALRFSGLESPAECKIISGGETEVCEGRILFAVWGLSGKPFQLYLLSTVRKVCLWMRVRQMFLNLKLPPRTGTDGATDTQTGNRHKRMRFILFPVSLVNLTLLAYIPNILPSCIVVPLTSISARHPSQGGMDLVRRTLGSWFVYFPIAYSIVGTIATLLQQGCAWRVCDRSFFLRCKTPREED